ncbi:MAG: hypothetical protein E6Q98_17135 [Rhodospirillaceae bacterium]|nr:MAG: hypothetical protein E6Q98_17135 [Rhodospirillaceae bacterium]
MSFSRTPTGITGCSTPTCRPVSAFSLSTPTGRMPRSSPRKKWNRQPPSPACDPAGRLCIADKKSPRAGSSGDGDGLEPVRTSDRPCSNRPSDVSWTSGT